MKKTNKSTVTKIDRRDFIKIGSVSTTGLLLGMHVACSPKPVEEVRPEPTFDFYPNVYLNINDVGDIKIIAHRSEMGQGVRTGLPLIIADELEADWSRVSIEQAPGDEAKYGNQNTDGSFTIRMFYMPMRRAGAMARMLLEQAAANQWQVDVSECKAKNHEVVHSSGKKLGFGELAKAAAELEAPKEEDIKLKDKSEFKMIGKATPIVDLQDIVQGTAGFGMDAKMPGMKIAVVARCPVAGGKAKSHNAEAAMAVPGVLQVVELNSPDFPTAFNPLGGIAVVAENTWAAMKGREALAVEWEGGINAGYDSEQFLGELSTNIKKQGTVRREQGNLKQTFNGASEVIEATYKLPHLSHASMEPPCALAHFEDGKCEVWAPSQHPQWAKGAVAGALGLEPTDVTVNVTLLGGGFGRKSKPDFIVEAAQISKETGQPIKLIWTREDDVQHDFYHACSIQHVRVALGEDKKVMGWNHRSSFPSIGGTSNKDADEPSAGEISLGMVDFPYDIGTICCETHKAPAQARIGWLRSVANIQHAYGVGSMLDEIAHARAMDPVENLLDLLGPDRLIKFDELVDNFQNYGEPLAEFPANTARLRNVIKTVAEKSNWGKALPSRKGQGICAHRSFLTYVACVVEVEVGDNGKITIPEVHYAVDCGVAVNTDRVKSQFEGGCVFALSGALRSSISFKEGKVEQSNFHDYELARMNDAPGKIHVHIIDSDEKPTGVGEPPVPPVAPALCNAIFAATGKRVRELPIKLA
ncbi:MAG: molybdopterin cofactor-binding domain-containing protein [Bacteroidota bacterium]